MNPSRPSSNFLLMLILATLLSALISPSVSLPAPHVPVQSVSNSHIRNTSVFRRSSAPTYTISGCHKHAPAECKGQRAGRIGEEAHCSANGRYGAHNLDLQEKCQSFGCGCKQKKGKWGSTLFGSMFSKMR